MSTHSVGRHMQGTPLLRWRSDGPGLGQCIGSQPDGSQCRSSQHGDQATRPRRLETLQPPVEGHTGTVRAVAAVPLPDGRTLLASGGDGTVRLWDPATGIPAAVVRFAVPAHSLTTTNSQQWYGRDAA